MKVERVQKWVMSALVLTTATIFATGISLLSTRSEQAGATPGLLSMAVIVELVALSAVRVINQKRVLTPWLVLALLPATLVWFLVVR